MELTRRAWCSAALLLACSREPPPSPAPRGTEHATTRERGLAVARAVSREWLARDVKAVARRRTPGSAGWREVRELVSGRLRELGYALELQDYGGGVNVIGSLPGKHEESVVVSAHYDHIAGCAGADDNASGVAAGLEVARLLAETQPRRQLLVAFWDDEERGLQGSRAFAERAAARGSRIAAALSLDAVGFARATPGSQVVPAGFDQLFPEQARAVELRGRRADFVALLANPAARALADELEWFARALGLPLVRMDVTPRQASLLPDLFRSDHASFWLHGFPGVLLTDTGEFRNPGYHCLRGPDTPESLDHEFLGRVTSAAAGAVALLLR